MYVFVRTNNPRPTFHLDMTDAEKQVMQQHVAYWTEKGELGIAVVFGPVLDPKGVYGIGIYRVDDLAHMRRLLAVCAKHVVHPERSEKNGVTTQPFKSEEAPDEAPS